MAKICVIGGGVIGLSSALRVLELCPGSEVKVIAEKFSPFTTTDVSGGFWEPYMFRDTPISLIKRWSFRTFDHMLQLYNSDSAKYTGASLVSGYRLQDCKETEEPMFKEKVLNYRQLSEEDLKEFPGMKSGAFFTTMKLDPGMYLQWLMKRFQRKGGRLEKRKIENINELFDKGYDIVINCTGLGAYHLCQDKDVQPTRGQVLRVSADWIKKFYIFIENGGAESYILPGPSYVVIGGTAQVGDSNLEVSQADTEKIWNGCTKYIPSLTEATIDSVQVGLRPCRNSIRLELEKRVVKGKVRPVIHNYGHGGGGVTLHWGCAEHVVSLVKEALPTLSPSGSKL